MTGASLSGPPPPDAWSPFTPAEVASRLADANLPWAIVGGWAIDLWLGRVTREHEDLEIAVPRSFFPRIRPLFPELEFFAVGSGEILPLAADEVHPPDRHQTWLLDPRSQQWKLDIMLEPGDARTWIFRRDERVRRKRREMVVDQDGILILRPEGVLLYKAKGCREKDRMDFENVRPVMDEAGRLWLNAVLGQVHPGHPWISELAG